MKKTKWSDLEHIRIPLNTVMTELSEKKSLHDYLVMEFNRKRYSHKPRILPKTRERGQRETSGRGVLTK